MDADLISGLLLAAVVLAGGGYLVHVVFGESIAAFLAERRARPAPAKPERPASARGKPAPGANDHLIGAVGRVVDDGGRSGEMRVRVGMERWSARLPSSDERKLPVGTEVEVKLVAGRVLEVEEKAAASFGTPATEAHAEAAPAEAASAEAPPAAVPSAPPGALPETPPDAGDSQAR